MKNTKPTFKQKKSICLGFSQKFLGGLQYKTKITYKVNKHKALLPK